MKILKSISLILGILSLTTLSTNSVFTSEHSAGDNEFSTGAWETPTPTPSPTASQSPMPEKVNVCHQTGSKTNPYNKISISINALDTHLAHGDIYPVPSEGCPGT